MEENRNHVELWGIAEAEPVFSHENHARRFYKFPLRIDRLSGQADRPVVVAEEGQLAACAVSGGTPLRVEGELRSYNNRSGQGSRLVLTVLARELGEGDGSHYNRIELSGVLCKQPNLRRTPLGRSICDLILAVNRHYGRADYLPCIAWGQVAAKIAEMSVGDRLAFEGRVQSRTYTKLVGETPVERTAFEVSIMQLAEEETK